MRGNGTFDPWTTPARKRAAGDRLSMDCGSKGQTRRSIHALGHLLVHTPAEAAEVRRLAVIAARVEAGSLGASLEAALLPPDRPSSGFIRDTEDTPSTASSTGRIFNPALIDPEDAAIASIALQRPLSEELRGEEPGIDPGIRYDPDEAGRRKEVYQAMNAVSASVKGRVSEQAQLNEAMAAAASIVESMASSLSGASDAIGDIDDSSTDAEINSALRQAARSLSTAATRITSTEDDLVSTRGKRAPSSGVSAFHAQSGQGGGGRAPVSGVLPPNPREIGETLQEEGEAINDTAALIEGHRKAAVDTLQKVGRVVRPIIGGVDAATDTTQAARGTRTPSGRSISLGGNTSRAVVDVGDDFLGQTAPIIERPVRTPDVPRRRARAVIGSIEDLAPSPGDILPSSLNIGDGGGGNNGISFLGGNGSLLEGSLDLPNPLTKVADVVTPITDSIGGKVGGIGTKIKGIEGDLKRTLLDSSPLGGISRAEGLLGSINGAVDGVVDLGKKFCLDLGFLNDFLGWLGDLLGKARDFVIAMLGKMLDLINKVFGFLYDLLGKALDWLGRMWDWLKDLLDFSFGFSISCET